MKPLEIKDLEDCFDGSFMKEVLLDGEITEDLIRFIGSRGELEYHPNFSRPYFRVDLERFMIIKGIQGNRTLRLILDRSNLDLSLQTFIDLINSYQEPAQAPSSA